MAKMDGEARDFATDGDAGEDDEGNCGKKLYLAKRYIDVEDMINDNDTEIYFDEQYKKRDIYGNEDPDFESKMMTDENGNSIVEDGHFAVLNLEDETEEYYIRKDGKWEKFSVSKNNPGIDFCNLRRKCLNVKRDCSEIQDNQYPKLRELLRNTCWNM